MFDRPTHANMHQFSTKPISFITCPNKFGIRCSVRLTSAKVALPSFKAYYIRYLWRQKSFMKHFCYISSFSLYTTKNTTNSLPTTYTNTQKSYTTQENGLETKLHPPKKGISVVKKCFFLHSSPSNPFETPVPSSPRLPTVDSIASGSSDERLVFLGGATLLLLSARRLWAKTPLLFTQNRPLFAKSCLLFSLSGQEGKERRLRYTETT